MNPIALVWLACTSTPTPPAPQPAPEAPKRREQVTRMTVHQGEVERTAWIHVPEGGGAGKPVVVVLAGGKLGEGRRMLQLFDGWFDKGVILVFPNAKNGGDDQEPQWEGVGGEKDTMEDVEFLKALVDQAVRKLSADRERVFVTGYDSGGFETWQLACFAADVFKGFAVVSSSLPNALRGCGAAGFPHPLMVLSGTEDPKVPWEGNGKTVPVFESIEGFAKKNGCDLKSKKEELLTDLVSDDGSHVKKHTWTCTGAPIQLLEVVGGAHAWPRKEGKEKGMDKTTRDIEGADEVMAFFGIAAPE